MPSKVSRPVVAPSTPMRIDASASSPPDVRQERAAARERARTERAARRIDVQRVLNTAETHHQLHAALLQLWNGEPVGPIPSPVFHA